MNKSLIASLCCYCLVACSPVNLPAQEKYQLSDFYTNINAVKSQSTYSLFISQPESTTGYLTNQMLYTDKSYQLNPFAHSVWFSPPATMIYPILIQSLDKNSWFTTIVASPYAGATDYRLDTQIIQFRQNFINKPSTFDLTIKAVLSRVLDNRSIASRLFVQSIPCPEETPYGGVIAANQASKAFTEQLSVFINTALSRKE